MKTNSIATWRDLFAALDLGPTDLGRAIGLPKQTAHDQIRNGLMPAYWKKLIAWAKANDRAEVTPELLGRLAMDHPPGVAAAE